MASSGVPVTETGVEMEEQSFIWKINNFSAVIVKDKALLRSQGIELSVGGRMGCPSKWKVHLDVDRMGLTEWLFMRVENVKDKRRRIRALSSCILQFSYTIQTAGGGTVHKKSGAYRGLQHGFRLEMFPFPVDVAKLKLEADLEIQITAKVYSPTRSDQPFTVVRAVEEFELKSTAKARNDLKDLVKAAPIRGGGAEIRITSRDLNKFWIPKSILAARSPVFEAMFRTDMSEANQDLLELPDITGKTLGILLHFLHFGELLPDWKAEAVVLELTNAAAKYEITDLLAFLGGMLGKVCSLENVVPLLRLASQLELKTAEEELLKFVREKGTCSSQALFEFMQICAGGPGMGSSEPDPNPPMPKKKKMKM